MASWLKNKWVSIAKALVAVGLLTVLFWQIDIQVFVESLKGANYWYILISALLFFPGVFVSSLRWQAFLEHYGVFLTKWVLFRLYLIGSFFNNFLPSSIGGDGYKWLAVSRTAGTKKGDVFSSIVLERAFGFLTLFVAGALLFPFFLPVQYVGFAKILVFVCILAAFVFLYFRLRLAVFLLAFGEQHQRVQKYTSTLAKSITFDSRRVLLLAVLYSLVFVAINVVGRLLVFSAFGIELNPLFVVFAVACVQVVGLLPISINSIGVTEGAMVFVYALTGVAPEVVVAVALVSRISMVLTSAVGGVILFFQKQS